MVRALRRNECVWYAPDQAFRNKGAEMVPFFGIPAATNVATSRLAELTGAAVLLYSHERLPDAKGYRVAISAPLEGYPGASPQADALRFNHFIEAEVRRIPEQYWWIHRRFKGLSSRLSELLRRRGAASAQASSGMASSKSERLRRGRRLPRRA